VSGPVTDEDSAPFAGTDAASPPAIELSDSREAQVGAFRVRRALPRRGRRTVGAWCFVDHMGPAQLTASEGLGIAPHPHIGLQTVTWLLSGEALHRDSLGSEQVIRPGQLNLMTAGHGVSHSEEGTGTFSGELHGVQLWVAQPDATRHGAPAFEHHGELPRVEVGAAVCTVLVGRFGDCTSPARRDTDHVGIDLDVHGEATLPLQPEFEHAIVVCSGAVRIGDRTVEPGHLAYLGRGRDELALSADGARGLLVGGTPFEDEIVMWWNYVGRTRDEITVAHREWTERSGRFGTVASPLPPTDVAPPPWSAP
jgi:redox-sensitive bicupin YhaK (pirin superfamily)